MEKKEFDYTGERLIPGINNINKIEHLHRYALAIDLAKGKNVLDIASGEGYGANILSSYAENVIGVDIDQASVDHASNKYVKKNLSFLVGSADNIPVPSHSIDLVVSFETIEHHNKHDEMMKEIKRVLKNNGTLIISTPERKINEELNLEKNIYHVKELYLNEFQELIDNNFKYSKMFFQKTNFNSVIIPDLKENANMLQEYFGDYYHIEKRERVYAPVYNICVASDCNISFLHTSLFDGTEIINQMNDTIQEIYNSRTYKLGYYIAYPYRKFMKILNSMKSH